METIQLMNIAWKRWCYIFVFQALSQRTDAEQHIKVLEKRFVRSQNELSTYAEEGEKIKAEMMSLRTLLEQVNV